MTAIGTPSSDPEHERRRRGPTAVETGQPGISEYGISTRVLELVREPAEPAAEHDADARLERRRLADARDRGVEAHAEPSATRRS